MNRYQSIISAVISAFCIFVLPVLNNKGIIIDESTATNVIVGIIAVGAFIWSCWKNHNITEAAHEAQAIMEDLKLNGNESAGEIADDEEGEF